MFRNNPRIKRDARRGAQNVSSTDIVDFPDHPVDREFIMWSEAETRWVMSGKDAVSTQEMEDRIQQLINGAPGTLDTLKELADTLGDPNNIATDDNSKTIRSIEISTTPLLLEDIIKIWFYDPYIFFIIFYKL